MFRPTSIISDKNFELVDVTMRDGALGRKFPYSQTQLKTYLHLLSGLGIRYAEIGFIGGPGKWPGEKNDSPNYDITPELNAVLSAETSLKLWSMIDSDNVRLKKEQVHTNKHSLVRLTADISKVQLLEEKIAICKQKGIPFSVNLKHTGSYELAQIQSLAKFAQDQGAQIFYVVDTSGTMTPVEVARIVSKLKDELSIELGFHGHDSLGFAAANSLAAIEAGCRYIDVSLCGIGAGGGNAITETFLLLTEGEQCDWNKLIEAGRLLNVPLEYQELQQRIFWGFIGCNTTVKSKLLDNPEAEIVKNAMEWKYGKVLSRGEHTTLRLLERATPLVTKTATHDGIEKLSREIEFLELNKAKLHYDFLPEVISYEVTEWYAYYSMPYIRGSLLRDYIYSEPDLALCARGVEEVVASLNSLHHELGTINSVEFSEKYYFDRLRKRWEELENTVGKEELEQVYSTENISSLEAQSIFSLIAKGVLLSIDGKSIDFSLAYLRDSMASLKSTLTIPKESIRLVHGDPHAGNILLNDKVTLLDPNGFLDGGDIAYDFSKLLVSFDWHDLSMLHMLEPAKIELSSGGIKVTNNKVYKDVRIKKRHKALRRTIMSFLNEKVVPMYVNSDPRLLQRIELLLYIHQFSFAPTLIKEKPQVALHILLNAISDYTMLVEEGRLNLRNIWTKE